MCGLWHRPGLAFPLTLLDCLCVLCVSVVLLQQFDENGHPEYLIRWTGYTSSHDQWEPLVNLQGSRKHIKAFEARLRHFGLTQGREPLGGRQVKSMGGAQEREPALKVRLVKRSL
jgi:hypothetical protein